MRTRSFFTQNMVRRVTFDRLNDAALNATRSRARDPTNRTRAGQPAGHTKITIAHFWQFECGSSEVTRYTHYHSDCSWRCRASLSKSQSFWCDFICSCLVMTSRCSTADPCRRRHTASPFSIRFSPHLRHFDSHFLAEPAQAGQRNANPI